MRQACRSLISDRSSNVKAVDSPKDQDEFNNEDFFRFTRGRMIFDAEHVLSQRYVRFNVRELARLAAKAVGSENCVKVQKCPDGRHNKVLSMKMNDGKEVIAKIPNPNAGRAHLTTASEVATMEFVCLAKDYKSEGPC